MPLRRIRNQADEPIEQFYRDLATNGTDRWEQVSEQMLRLVQHLERHNIGSDVWVFTSLANLHFTPIDDYSVAIMQVSYVPDEGYRVDYTLPPEPLSSTEHPLRQTSLTMEDASALLQNLLQIWNDSGMTPRYEIKPTERW